MTLRCCVSLWTLWTLVWTLVWTLLLVDVQALCADNCPAETTQTSTTTSSIAFQSLSNCSVSTANRSFTNGSVSGLTPGVLHQVQVHCLNCCKLIFTNPGPVRDLNAISTTSSISVTWRKPEGESAYYRVKWEDDNGSGTVNTTETSQEILNLTAGTKYVITVTAVAGSQTEGEASPLDQYTMPEKPGNIQVTDRRTDFLAITWSFSGGKDYFLVNVPNADPTVLNTSQTATNIAGLLPGRVFSVTVTAVAGNLRTGSDQFSFATVPTPPQSVAVAARTNSSILLTWSVPERMDGAPDVSYSVTCLHEGIQRHRSTTDNNVELSLLSSGTNYSINIQTTGPQQFNSTPVHVSSFTLPNAVLNLVAQANSTTAVTVQWSDPPGVQPYYNYSVEVFNASRDLVKSKTVISNSVHIPDLESASKYLIRVTTVAAPDTFSTVKETFSYTMPKAVTELTAINANATSVQLRWLRQSDHNPSLNYLVKALRGGHMVDSGSTQTETYTFHQLNPGTLYNFQVFAAIERVQSRMAVIEVYTKPGAVSNMTTIGDTTELSVSWELASGQVFSYSVQLNRAGQLVDDRTDLTNETTSARFTGLDPGVEYCVVLFTKSGPHVTESSAACNATFPNPPGPITVQFVTQTSINFTWTPPLDMEPDRYNFTVTTFRGSVLTVNSWYLLDELQSGTPYDISVATVGVRQYESTAVRTRNYTRPYSVTNLTQTDITTDSAILEWIQPEKKSDYSYLVQVASTSSSFPLRVHSTMAAIDKLESGSNYSFAVTTQTADGTEAEPVTVSYFTYPHAVSQLVAETLNTTAVRLRWTRPLQYKDHYLYWVEVTGCDYQRRNLTEEMVELSELNPGTNCVFCVSVKAGNATGEENCTSQYTKPETVQPTISNQGSTESVEVSWTKPEGNVEKYKVHLNIYFSDSNQPVRMKSVELDGNSTGYKFTNLSAGRLYSTAVITYSGPFHATSQSKETATFPNPPGPIYILSKTTRSIRFRWIRAPFMESAEFSYQLTLVQSPDGNVTSNSTTTTTSTFDSLPSGTSFTIFVSTLGILDFESQRVNETVTTVPLSVRNLITTAEETRIHVSWEKPDEVKDSYRYRLFWDGPGEIPGESPLVQGTKYTIDGLSSGSGYDITVTTETADGTQAEQRRISNYTRAKPVKNLSCEGPNEDDAQIILSWVKPDGQNSGFRVSVNDRKIDQNITCCGHNVSKLLHHTEYKISVETLSSGQESTPEILHCTTGITNPPIPPDYQSKVTTDAETHNKFSIVVQPGLFNQTKGPITHVGVLVKKSGSGSCSDCKKSLEKTYDDFKADPNLVYLATVAELLSRSSQEVRIEVGSNEKWENYLNGALEANTKYQYAIVLFTSLTLHEHHVDPSNSLLSITDFSFAADLPISAATVGIAVGVTLGIFCVLFCVLIGFIIFWRRMAKKKSPDIQIHSLRAKVVPVKVEDYEAYFRKQKADSNCGFAEEFEDLKPVGTTQAKIQALSVENKPKNRYTNVLPYDSTRVKLSLIHGNPSDDYINANYMPGYTSKKEFIAAQGPLPATVNEFWRMIWEKNVQTLVMLTRCNEQGRVKCEQYWSPGAKHFGNITVTTTSDIPLEDWTIRDFSVKNVKTAETRSVRQFHFTAWPDHGVPETTELLIGFRHLVREHMNQYSRHSPTVVHCSAGVGRTGTFIAIDHLIFQIERENMVDVYGIVHELRMHRTLMVQTEDQYVFLNQCAMDLIRSRTGTNVDLIYQNTAALSIYENLEPLRGSYKSKNHNA